ncbi:MAG TPA: hypothetical protein VNA57_07135 [Acidimicrobiales bacterium]|nr:hypothetical protein [Acidimicrobiales bacterium]
MAVGRCLPFGMEPSLRQRLVDVPQLVSGTLRSLAQRKRQSVALVLQYLDQASPPGSYYFDPW